MNYPFQSIVALLCGVFCLFSCGKEKSTGIIEDVQIINESVKVVKNSKNAEDFRDHLKVTEPATEAQFQHWLPVQLGELKRIEFTESQIPQKDIASAGAVYKNNTDKKLIVSIVDGASKDGLLAIQSHYMAQTLQINNEKPSQYQKTYEKNGLKVLETYVKQDNFYRVSFLYAMRFGITLESYGLSYDAVWQSIAMLDLKQLDHL